MGKGADLLVAALENEGVKRIFGIPGEENLAVVEALRRPKIDLVLTRHEQAAAFMPGMATNGSSAESGHRGRPQPAKWSAFGI
jgi:thiamine pyrophosphate-dependent acetolactate synthase large subunit-like protein